LISSPSVNLASLMFRLATVELFDLFDFHSISPAKKII